MFQKGFTLLELLLSIALISLLAALSVPVYQSFHTQRTADMEHQQGILLMRRAQSLARASWYDDDWGIKVQTESITLFKGNDFTTRTTSFDEVFPFANLSAESTPEIYFESVSGTPSSTLSVDFTTTNDYQFNISINEEGVIFN